MYLFVNDIYHNLVKARVTRALQQTIYAAQLEKNSIHSSMLKECYV